MLENEEVVFQFSVSDESFEVTELAKAKEILEMMHNGKFDGGSVHFCHINFQGYDFQNIKKVRFMECRFENCSFENMEGVTFYLGNIIRSRILGDLTSVSFDGTTIHDVYFIEAEMGRIDFCDVSFRETRFHGCKQKTENAFGINWIKFTRCEWTKNQDVKFIDCDFYSIDIFDCNKSGFVFNDLKCIPKASDIIKKYFKTTNEGIIAYKVFNEFYPMPEDWEIKEGATITRLSNRNAYDECGEGINVSTLTWLGEYVGLGIVSGEVTIWKVLIPWEEAVGITVPYNFEGKIRCESIKLLEPLTKEEATKKIYGTEALTSKEEN